MAISRDSIGLLALREPLSLLRNKCSVAAETVHVSLEGYRSPAILFPFADLSVMAVQFAPALDPRQPADGWQVSGNGGILPGGLPSNAAWAELTREYGDAEGSTDVGSLVVTFRTTPGLSFVIGVDQATLTRIDESGSLSAVPDSAHIKQIWIEVGDSEGNP